MCIDYINLIRERKREREKGGEDYHHILQIFNLHQLLIPVTSSQHELVHQLQQNAKECIAIKRKHYSLYSKLNVIILSYL